MSVNSNYLFDKNKSVVIDVSRIIRKIKSFWFPILMVVIAFTLTGSLIAQLTYVKTYTSKGTFAINVREYSRDQRITGTDISASQILANSFVEIIKSQSVFENVIKSKGYDITHEELKKFIDVQLLPETNILELRVTTKDRDLSFNIANDLIEAAPGELKKYIESGNIKISDYATVAQKPNPNNRNVVFPLLGFLLGIGFCVGVVIFFDVTSSTVKSRQNLEDVIDCNVVGVIPVNDVKIYKSKAQSVNFAKMFIDNKRTNFAFVEAFKSLRTRLESIFNKKNIKTIAVTSTLENEGKSIVAINLALALAKKGKRVLLCDCNFNDPSIHMYLGIKQKPGDGVINVMAGKSDIDTASTYIVVKKIHVLTSGVTEAVHQDLTDSHSVGRFVSQLQESDKYDYIIFVTPASLNVSDAEIYSQFVDGILFVVKEDYATITDIQMCYESLSKNKAPILGCVLNASYSAIEFYKYGYGYRYRYGYRYGYGFFNKGQKT